jgi:hypothetical protein
MAYNTNYGNVTTPYKDSLYSQNFDKEGVPLPPPGFDFWIDNLGDKIITNTGAFIIFNPG